MKLWNCLRTKVVLTLAAPALVAGAALADPVSVTAQTITPAELAGSWMRGPYWSLWGTIDSVVSQEIIETYGADHIIRSQRRFNGKLEETVDSVWHWALHGDTLITFSDAKDTLPTRPKDRPEPGKQLIAQKGDQVMRTGLGNGACGATDTLRRVDLAKLPPPPAKPPTTVDPAALAGTWVASWKEWRPNRDSLVQSDSLILGADKTAHHVQRFDPPGRFQSMAGTWALNPGDLVGVSLPVDPKVPTKLSTFSWRVLTVQGQRVLSSTGSVCNPIEVYKRVSP